MNTKAGMEPVLRRNDGGFGYSVMTASTLLLAAFVRRAIFPDPISNDHENVTLLHFVAHGVNPFVGGQRHGGCSRH